MSSGTGKVGERGPLPCRSCLSEQLHEIIAPVSRGQVYLRCDRCGNVFHTPKEGLGA